MNSKTWRRRRKNITVTSHTEKARKGGRQQSEKENCGHRLLAMKLGNSILKQIEDQQVSFMNSVKKRCPIQTD